MRRTIKIDSKKLRCILSILIGLLCLNIIVLTSMDKEIIINIQKFGLQKGEVVVYEDGVKEYMLFKNDTTGSMYPFIKNETTIYSIKVDENTSLEIGDVIIYVYPDGDEQRYIQHRIYKIEYINDEKYYQMKGDANKYPDRYFVPREAIIRKITGVKYG